MVYLYFLLIHACTDTCTVSTWTILSYRLFSRSGRGREAKTQLTHSSVHPFLLCAHCLTSHYTPFRVPWTTPTSNPPPPHTHSPDYCFPYRSSKHSTRQHTQQPFPFVLIQLHITTATISKPHYSHYARCHVPDSSDKFGSNQTKTITPVRIRPPSNGRCLRNLRRRH